jgi:acyl-homoserine-lactone acylase
MMTKTAKTHGNNVKSIICLLLAVWFLIFIAGCSDSSKDDDNISTEGVTPPIVDESEFHVTIRRTAHGIPHIKANDWAGLGYGYAYAAAEDNICRLADVYVTVRGERSKYFGPDKTFYFPGNAMAFKNSDSDFFFKLLKARGIVEKITASPFPVGFSPEAKALLRGYAAGYNRYLRDHPAETVTDPTCGNAKWIREISELDVYRACHMIHMMAGSDVSVSGIGHASPKKAQSADQMANILNSGGEELSRLAASLRPSMGSNAIAVGKDATESGRGLLLGNPHMGWLDSGSFYQVHMTIPGEYDVSGISFLGIPLVAIGANSNVAWSHTVSTAFRFVPVQLDVVNTYGYRVDGKVEQMKAWPLEIEVLKDDGSIGKLRRTLYTTRFGPMCTALMDLEILSWTSSSGFALLDPNEENLRAINHFVEMGKAKNVHEVKQVLEKFQAIPWANTIAADSNGEAFYGDITVVSNVSDKKATACGTAFGQLTFRLMGLPVLDGSSSECMPDTAADAIVPGIMGISRLPSVFRNDFVLNSNDSYWLVNPEQPLTGYDRIIGTENTQLSLRTRMGHTLISDRLSGKDGLVGTKFNHENMKEIMFNDRNLLGELWVDDLVSLLGMMAAGNNAAGQAAQILGKWDRTDGLDSPGALLFRRIAEQLLGVLIPAGTTYEIRVPFTSGFLYPFSTLDPIGTPRGLNILNPKVWTTVDDTLKDFNDLGIPLDASFREYQYVERGGEKIPLHGGLDPLGLFCVINIHWDPAKKAYVNPYHGNTYIQVVSFEGREYPRMSTITTYSLSQNVNSPWHKDQTLMYSNKEWIDLPFSETDIAAQTISILELSE